jgi:lysophospholipase L1-like esterase
VVDLKEVMLNLLSKKIPLILLGLLLIALLEVSLSLTGKVFLYTRTPSTTPPDSENLILCMGDSHTFGVGTSHEYSYPKQLEAVLNLNNPKTSFSVVNLGIPGNSTREQVRRVSRFLTKNRADLIILLTGRNNYYEVKLWKDNSFPMNIITGIKQLRSYKIMQYVLGHFFKIGTGENINAPIEKVRYEEYMRYHLGRARSLCERHGSRLLLLSYHSSHDEYIERFAEESGILYFNLCEDFLETIPQEDIHQFVSADSSHMNVYGYKIFTELLYNKMFLHREDLDLGLNPLSRKISKDSFRENPARRFLRYVFGKSIFYEN